MSTDPGLQQPGTLPRGGSQAQAMRGRVLRVAVQLQSLDKPEEGQREVTLLEQAQPVADVQPNQAVLGLQPGENRIAPEPV